MSNFIEVPVNNRSIWNRKLVQGVGTNDADYQINPIINGRQIMCPIYRTWHSMLVRCYSEKDQARRPTYKGCSVCDEWLIFSKFRAWMKKQDWEGKQIDKDILVKGNKTYSAATCCFVTQANNMIEARAKRYKFISPVGHAVDVYNLSEFCRNNGLNHGGMSQVHLGKASQHKGWTSANPYNLAKGK